MTTKAPATTRPNRHGGGKATDHHKMTRLVVDIPQSVAVEFAVLAARRQTTKRALMARLIMDVLSGKSRISGT